MKGPTGQPMSPWLSRTKGPSVGRPPRGYFSQQNLLHFRVPRFAGVSQRGGASQARRTAPLVRCTARRAVHTAPEARVSPEATVERLRGNPVRTDAAVKQVCSCRRSAKRHGRCLGLASASSSCCPCSPPRGGARQGDTLEDLPVQSRPVPLRTGKTIREAKVRQRHGGSVTGFMGVV